MGMMSTHGRIRRAVEEKKKAALELAKQNAPVDVDKMLVNELKEFAKARGFDITGLNKKEEIRLRILEFLNRGKSGEGDGQPNGNAQEDNTGQSDGSADQPKPEGAEEIDTD